MKISINHFKFHTLQQNTIPHIEHHVLTSTYYLEKNSNGSPSILSQTFLYLLFTEAVESSQEL